jgi:hypothetical protein
MPNHRSLSPPRWRWLVLLPALGCVSCSGGGGDLIPTQGTVLYKNEPLKGAVVTFHPKGVDEVTARRPTGLTKEDGTFTLTTGQSEGAPPGQYVVTVTCHERPAAKDGPVFNTAAPEPQDRLRGAYSDRASSRIEVEIKKGMNRLEPFNLQ